MSKPFYIPEDMEATKAIPIIQQEQLFENVSDETIVLKRGVRWKNR